MHQLKIQDRPLVADDLVEFFSIWGDILTQKVCAEAATFLTELRDEFRCRLDELLLRELLDNGQERPHLQLERGRFPLSEEAVEAAKGLIRYFVNTAIERVDIRRHLHRLNNPPNGGMN